MSTRSSSQVHSTSQENSTDAYNANPRRPPHPLVLKAFDSQIHILFKAWISCAGSLPLTPEAGAAELFKLMDARVAIFGAITHEFNRIIAEFSLTHGPEHDILVEANKKDRTAYARCTEDHIPNLCYLWNLYSELFRERFRETFGFPKKGANLMKEELSRLLQISKAMERAWLAEKSKRSGSIRKSNERDEGIKKWIAATAAHISNHSESINEEDASMKQALEENEAAAKRMTEDLRERMGRRKDIILNANYVEEYKDKWTQAQIVDNDVTENYPGDGTSALQSETSRNDSMWGDGAQEKRMSDGEDSYNEFNVDDVRYLRPVLLNRPPTPMPLLSSKPVILRPPTPDDTKSTGTQLPSDYSAQTPPPPPPPPSYPQLRTSRSKKSLRSSSGENSTSINPSVLLAPKEVVRSASGFSLRSFFFNKPAVKDPTVRQLASGAIDLMLQPVSSNTNSTPRKSLSKARSMGNLKSPLKSTPPPLPNTDFSKYVAERQVGDTSMSDNGRRYEEARPRSAATDVPVPDLTASASSCDSQEIMPASRSASGATLKGKCSMFFGGKKVKEVPKGEEDAFLEQHAYRGAPF
ncbi:hypothetical protein DFH27DRAFT_522322 [Peziza echinospora]|nr:hypothetical protein DFH27DRAFT_522322 [Peziza echinospora]